MFSRINIYRNHLTLFMFFVCNIYYFVCLVCCWLPVFKKKVGREDENNSTIIPDEDSFKSITIKIYNDSRLIVEVREAERRRVKK